MCRPYLISLGCDIFTTVKYVFYEVTIKFFIFSYTEGSFRAAKIAMVSVIYYKYYHKSDENIAYFVYTV